MTGISEIDISEQENSSPALLNPIQDNWNPEEAEILSNNADTDLRETSLVQAVANSEDGLRRSSRLQAQITNVNARPSLLQDLSRHGAIPICRRWNDLSGTYVHLVNDIGILLPPPVEIRI